MKDTRETVVEILKKYNINPYLADEDVTAGRDILCKICEKITYSDFGIIELTAVNPNVMLEFGLILGRRKPVFILFNKGLPSTSQYIPVDIIALDRIEYANQPMLATKFERGIQQYTRRLDRKQKELVSMMELAKGTARDKDYMSADKLLEVIFERMQVEKGNNGRFIDLLKDILAEAKEDRVFIHYALALARASAFQKNLKDSMIYANAVLDRTALDGKSALEKMDELIDKKLTQELLRREKQFFKDPIGTYLKLVERPTKMEEIMSHMLYVLLNTSNPEKAVSNIVSMFKHNFTVERRIRFPIPALRSNLWETSDFDFVLAGWLRAIARYYPKKEQNVVKLVQEADKTFQAILEKYYGRFM